MRRKSPDPRGLFVLIVVLSSGLAAVTLGASRPTVLSVSSFQAAVPSTSPGARGTAVLEEKGSDQIFSVTVSDLSGTSNGTSGSFGVFVSTANTNNSELYLIGPMSLQGTNATWVLKYEAAGTAPAQLSDTNQLAQLAVTNLVDLAGKYLLIANPTTTTNLVTFVLSARIPPFTTKAKAPHFNRRSRLTVPSVAPANPHEKGYVRTIYTGSQGRSVFDLTAKNLSGGGTYSVFIEDPPSSLIMTNIGPLLISTNNMHNGTFNADTRVGETLPLQVPTVQDLSGRAIQIRDAFDEIHLQGTIP